jgi:hypothetical protein
MRIAEIADVFSGRAPTKPQDDDPAARLPMLALRDIGVRITPRDRLELVETAKIVDTDRLLMPGDVVVTSRGRVRAAVAEGEHAGTLVGPNLVWIRLRTELPPALLAAYLRHPEVERELFAEMVGTATSGFSVDGLRQLEVIEIPAGDAATMTELVSAVDEYHDEVVEAVRLLKQGVSEYIYQRMTPSEARR